jgi:hypothetical protein
MDKQKLVKFAVKGAIGLVTSVVIGATIKQEARVTKLVEEHFATKPSTD